MVLKENLSRRKFLAGTGGALALTPMMGLNQIDLPSMAAAQTGTIITRKLGRTGIEVPIVSMGVMRATDHPPVIIEAYKQGVRLFDTSRRYANNEEALGKVIRDLGVRNQVYIQSKCGQFLPFNSSTAAQRRQWLMEDMDRSLAALQMDYVDIFLLHAPSMDELNDSGYREALTEIKKQKKARYIGFATHSGVRAEELNNAAKDGFFDTITLSFNITMAQDTALLNAIKNAANAGIGIVAMKTQSGGTGKPGQAGPPINHTAILKWALRHPEITTAIPGVTNFDHLKEDISVAFGLDYTDAERKFLTDRNLQARLQFCQQCEICVQTCPKGVDIPTLMRTHMYAARYGDFVYARETFNEIAENASLKNCTDCASCRAKCAGYVSIADNIRDLKSMYL